MHFITKVATITLMIVIMKDWLKNYRDIVSHKKQSSIGSLYLTQTIPNKRKKN